MVGPPRWWDHPWVEWSPSSITDLFRGEKRKLSKVEAEVEEMLLESQGNQRLTSSHPKMLKEEEGPLL